MHSMPREILKEILTKYSTSVCDDPRRCEGLIVGPVWRLPQGG